MCRAHRFCGKKSHKIGEKIEKSLYNFNSIDWSLSIALRLRAEYNYQCEKIQVFFKNEDKKTVPCLFTLSKLQYANFSEKLTDGATGKWHFSIGVHSL